MLPRQSSSLRVAVQLCQRTDDQYADVFHLSLVHSSWCGGFILMHVWQHRLEKKFGDAANGFMAKSGLNWVGRQMQKNVVGRTIFYGANYDMHSVVDETHQDYDKKVVAVWQNAGL